MKPPLDKHPETWYELNQREIRLVEKARKMRFDELDFGAVKFYIQDGVILRTERTENLKE